MAPIFLIYCCVYGDGGDDGDGGDGGDGADGADDVGAGKASNKNKRGS